MAEITPKSLHYTLQIGWSTVFRSKVGTTTILISSVDRAKTNQVTTLQPVPVELEKWGKQVLTLCGKIAPSDRVKHSTNNTSL